ncbi:MAG TPA: hypothetical protein VKR58_06220 [Aquella sp.]|nr:hypothetical protein [Aquella sp.]
MNNNNILKSRFSQIEGAHKTTLRNITELRTSVARLEQDKLLIQEAQGLTKKCLDAEADIRKYLENLLTAALHAIFGTQYSFILEPKIKDDMVVGLIPLVKEGEYILNVKQIGAGMKFVISYVIRLVFLLFTKAQTNVQILDEQGTNLSPDKFNILLDFIRDIQKSIPYQAIWITHVEASFDDEIVLIRRGGYTCIA